MIDVGKFAKQVEKLCSNARANRDAYVGSVSATISLPPAPYANVTDASAAGPTKSSDASVFLPSNYDILSPTVVAPIDSTDAVPTTNPPSPADSRTNADSTTATAFSQPYTMDAAPATDPPLPADGRANANSTDTTTTPHTSDSTTNEEKKIFEFFRNDEGGVLCSQKISPGRLWFGLHQYRYGQQLDAYNWL